MAIDELTPNYADEYVTGKTSQEVEQEKIQALMQEAWSENWQFDREKASQKEKENRKKFWRVLQGFFAATYRATLIDDDIQLHVDGYTFNVKNAVALWRFPESVEVYYPRYGGNWSKGKNATKYRLLKKGGYNYVDVARDVVNYAIAEVENARAEKRRNANLDASKEVRRAMRLRSYASVRVTPSSDLKNPVRVEFKIDRAMTADQATTLINMLRELGATSSYDFLKDGEEFKED